jgi:hypothetical protein
MPKELLNFGIFKREWKKVSFGQREKRLWFWKNNTKKLEIDKKNLFL